MVGELCRLSDKTKKKAKNLQLLEGLVVFESLLD